MMLPARSSQRISAGAVVAALCAAVVVWVRFPHTEWRVEDVVRRYDTAREASLWRDWGLAEHLYRELEAVSLPTELLQSLQYHAALTAYEAGRIEEAAARCRTALASDPSTPWRGSLDELLGLSEERLGHAALADAAYRQADLPFSRQRAQRLASGAQHGPLP